MVTRYVRYDHPIYECGVVDMWMRGSGYWFGSGGYSFKPSRASARNLRLPAGWRGAVLPGICLGFFIESKVELKLFV